MATTTQRPGVDFDTMAREIADSFKRSAGYGISRQVRSPGQKRLTPDELAARREAEKGMLEASSRFINRCYQLLRPEEFMFAIADRDGYILDQHGADALLPVFADLNCAPGFRWTEKDVGTAAISLCHARKIPIQINDKDHFCVSAHDFTSSAAPILDRQGELIGIITVGGRSRFVHAHTLLMLIAAAQAIERELYLTEVNTALRREAAFLEHTIESSNTGIMIVDRSLSIVYINRRGAEILAPAGGAKKNLIDMGLVERHLAQAETRPGDWENREINFSSGKKTVSVIVNVKPVYLDHGVPGYLIDFEAAQQARLSAQRISGSQVYFTFDHIIGRSAALQDALALARRAAEVDSTVLIQGETGTGKELFAQAIHNASRKRRRHPFVPINCAAIPSELLESELFGYVDGAFTGAVKGGRPGKFELAGSGTILLDEIGDMPLSMQSKLLRVMQTREIYRIGADKPLSCHCRIIACTHHALIDNVKRKLFREDLFYRLNVFPILLPPLRDRGAGDILELAEFFLQRSGDGKALTADAAQLLSRYLWPGNIRELENVLQRASYLATGDKVDANLLSFAVDAERTSPVVPGTLAHMERKCIEDALAATEGNMAKAARMLGISRATLYRKREQLGI